ncbi:Longevity-assurance family protein [Entamoeba marina]
MKVDVLNGWTKMSKTDKMNVVQLFCILPIVLVCIPTSFSRTEMFNTFPSPFQLLWFLIPFCIIYAIRISCIECLFPLYGNKFIYYKHFWSKDMRDFRVKRFGIVLFKGLYFWFSAPLGILLFRNEDWFPACLFGTGKQDITLLWEGFPGHQTTVIMTMYYCIELGYHVHSLVYHMQSERRADFFENLLHHVATVFLIVFSYVNNCGRIGILVMILHDIVDAIIYLSKTVNDLPNQYPVYIGTFFIAFSFLRFRLYTLGVHIIPAAIDAIHYIPEGIPGSYVVYGLLVSLLCVLLVLHAWWFYLIMMIFVKASENKGKLSDPHCGG